MTASPYASDAKIAEALAVIEAEHVGTREQTILQQIFVACAMGGVPLPATLTITFGNGVTSDGTFYLTINGVEYSISFGQSGLADVPIYQDNEGNLEAYSADYIANAFSSYITSTFSSSLTVAQPSSNVVTLTTVATSGASLSAVCSLPIFPNVPLGGNVPPVPQNLRLASVQNPDSITVEWDALVESPDYEVEVYTPDDIWVSLGGTMGGITKEYGISDGMVYGATYSFRVRSTFDFVTFSEWSAPLYGVVAPLQTLYYLNQGSGLWDDVTNWFEDSEGTIPHGAVPTGSYNCEINEGYLVNEVPSSGYNSITNKGTVSTNLGTIDTNLGTVTNNSGTITSNYGTTTSNNSGDGPGSPNYGTITTNYGTVEFNGGTVTTNNDTISYNYGMVDTNASSGTVTNNSGTVEYNETGGTLINNNNMVISNYGTVSANYNTVTYNYGTVDYNGGTVTYNCGTIYNDQGSSGSCP